MKEYLKMADVFDCEVESDADLMFSDSLGNIANFSGYKTQCRYSSHAINSHDELVQLNHELLAALKQVVGDVRALADHSYGVHGLHQNGDLAPWNSLFSGGFFESWLLSVDDADAVIAKAEGGAA